MNLRASVLLPITGGSEARSNKGVALVTERASGWHGLILCDFTFSNQERERLGV